MSKHDYAEFAAWLKAVSKEDAADGGSSTPEGSRAASDKEEDVPNSRPEARPKQHVFEDGAKLCQKCRSSSCTLAALRGSFLKVGGV